MKHIIIVRCTVCLLIMAMLASCASRDQSRTGNQQPIKPKVQSHVRSPDSHDPITQQRYPKTEARPQQLGRVQPNNRMQEKSEQQSQSGTPIKQSSNKQQMQKAIPEAQAPKIPQEVRGIYVSGWVAGGTKLMGKLTRLVEQTDLNAMVIDVKNDFGQVTYDSQLPEVSRLGADANPAIKDMPALLKRLKAKGIYTIGRVVAFKDPLLAKQKSEWAIHTKTGKLWQDRKGVSWVDPYHPDVRAYNIAIAEEAARLGFEEIQFDYVRFPDNAEEMDKVVQYHNPDGRAKQDVIGGFLNDARPVLHQAGAAVSADVFGLVTSSRDDMGIGQTWRQVASAVDVVSPMTYPSHYSSGMYGIKNPDLQPGKVVRQAMEDAVRRNRVLENEGKKTAVVRPWLQAFTATWVHPHQPYRMREIEQQVLAAKQAGVRQFLLWSSNCKYSYHS